MRMHQKGKNLESAIHWGSPLLLFILALMAILLPEYLFNWDERFHALVARNLLDDPTITKLYPEALISSFDHREDWYHSHIWLHKPPLFSYQMALFMKLFGTSLWAMRLNSLVMYMALFFALRGIGRLLKLPKIDANLLALTALLSPMLLSMVNGSQSMEHNDITFIGHIGLAYYFYIRYEVSERRKWTEALLVGLFSGCAVLTKWLPGLLPLLPMGLMALFHFRARRWGHLLIALGTVALLNVPWYLYTFSTYPELAQKEFAYNGEHFFEAVEKHSRVWYYHFWVWVDKLWIVLLLTLLLAVGMFRQRIKIAKLEIALAAAVVFIFTFYTVAATKLPAYSLIALVPLVAFLASAGWKISAQYRRRALLFVGAVAVLFTSTWLFTRDYQKEREDRQEAQEFYSKLEEELPRNAVIFNTAPFEFPEAMFYANRIAYEHRPLLQWLEEVKQKGYQPYVLVRDSSSFDFAKYRSYKLLDYQVRDTPASRAGVEERLPAE